MKSKSITKKQIKRIAEIVSYGLGHLELGAGDVSFEESSYTRGGIETLGHMAACCITQWITNDSTGTGETVEALHLEQNPSREQIEEYLTEYLKVILQSA